MRQLYYQENIQLKSNESTTDQEL